MQTIFDGDFEDYCWEVFQRYITLYAVLGIDGDDSFDHFKENNIETLEMNYVNGSRRTLH
jgi:hypothetical protein|tara:strand:+ start:51 stop:230 length:180 start_codon:yes stop_codon:yes gene_type:complete